MENVKFITDEDGNEHAIIDKGNGEFTSMFKSTYDEIIANQTVAVLKDNKTNQAEEIPAE